MTTTAPCSCTPTTWGPLSYRHSRDGTLQADVLYYPWGQFWGEGNSSLDDQHFAGMQERDIVTGYDPTPNRSYNSTPGRWFSPDPLAGDVSKPQPLNRYAYALYW